jgi:hypothetical protein
MVYYLSTVITIMKLKNILFALLILQMTHPAFSQNQEMILYNLHNLKKGVYKNSEEFKFNRPSLQIPLKVEEKHKMGIFTYLVRYNVDSFKLKKGEFWGFCDGENVYVNRDPKSRPDGKIWFEKIINIDRVCYFKQVMISRGGGGTMGPGGMMTGGGGSYVEDMMLSLETGDILELTKSTFTYLLSYKDPELLESFKKESEKRQKLVLYLQKYCDKHRDEPISDVFIPAPRKKEYEDY